MTSLTDIADEILCKSITVMHHRNYLMCAQDSTARAAGHVEVFEIASREVGGHELSALLNELQTRASNSKLCSDLYSQLEPVLFRRYTAA